MPALRITQLHNCRVFGGPITGATFMDDVQGCTFVLASFQVRMHLRDILQNAKPTSAVLVKVGIPCTVQKKKL